MTQEIENLNTPSEIAEWASKSAMLNMADNYTAISCSDELNQTLQKYFAEYVNIKAPKFGLFDLRQKISHKIEKLYDKKYNPDTEITITLGAKQGVLASVISLAKEGDEVLIFEPSHKSYDAAILLSGAKPVYVSLKAPHFNVDWEEVQKMIHHNTRMIIINSPHYPTGSVFTELDMIRLQKIISGTKIIILMHESSEHIIFDDEMHQSVAMYPKLAERSIHVSSFCETFAIPSWNVGYCTAPESLMKEIRKVALVLSNGVSLPFQKAISEHLDNPDNYRRIAKIYQAKRDLFLSGIEESRFKAVPTKGGYFQILSYDDISNDGDLEIVKRLMNDYQLAVVPLGFYYHERSKKKLLRFNFSIDDAELARAIEVLNKV